MSVDTIDEADAPVAEPDPKTPEARCYAFEYEVRAESPYSVTIEGYAAVFNQPAQVRDWRGVYTETIERGAFAKTLREQRTPQLLFEHGRHPMIGRLPPGVIRKASEDNHGLHIRGEMFNNWLMRPVIDAVRAQAIEGMSFEMVVMPDKESWSADRSQRSIREVALLPELTITATPVYGGTSISLRSLMALAEVDDPEVRAALEAALGTSTATPEPTPDHSVIPPETLAIWRRHMTRRHAQ